MSDQTHFADDATLVRIARLAAENAILREHAERMHDLVSRWRMWEGKLPAKSLEVVRLCADTTYALAAYHAEYRKKTS